MGTTFERTFIDTNVVGPTRYFVRAVDAEGNRSATTPVISVNPPPPAAATLLASGATWSYRADGEDLGTAWRSPGFDTTSWPTGPAELGWGDGDEATVIPSGTITQYFVKHLNISNPSQYQTVTVRLKRDDGAVVYVNGVEVVRDNLPAGPADRDHAGERLRLGHRGDDVLRVPDPGEPVRQRRQHDRGRAAPARRRQRRRVFDLELVARNGTETNPPSTPAPAVSDVTSSTADRRVAGVDRRHQRHRLPRAAQRHPRHVHDGHELPRLRADADHGVHLRRPARSTAPATSRRPASRTPPPPRTRCSSAPARCGPTSPAASTRARTGASPASTPRRGPAARPSSAGVTATRRPSCRAARSRSTTCTTSTSTTRTRSSSSTCA